MRGEFRKFSSSSFLRALIRTILFEREDIRLNAQVNRQTTSNHVKLPRHRRLFPGNPPNFIQILQNFFLVFFLLFLLSPPKSSSSIHQSSRMFFTFSLSLSLFFTRSTNFRFLNESNAFYYNSHCPGFFYRVSQTPSSIFSNKFIFYKSRLLGFYFSSIESYFCNMR